MRGNTYCRAHRKDLPPTRLRDILAEGFYSELFTEQELVDLAVAVANPSLTDEIGMLKVLIRRALERGEDPNTTLKLVGRAVEQLIKAWKLQRTISGETAEGLAAAMAQVLDELSAELGVDL